MPFDDDALPPARMVDVFFPVDGRTLARDHRAELAAALEQAWPALRDCPGLGLITVNLVHGAGDPALLSRRARLGLRLPIAHADGARALAGHVLQVGAHRITLGEPQARELLPHTTLNAHFVDAGGHDELHFLAQVDAELDALGVDCRSVCGRHLTVQAGPGAPGARLGGFSLLLHGLRPAASLKVLEAGLGPHRRLGCGVFVPHKSAAAVGEG
jgi:CRISPR-associated protein Cas6